MKRLFIMATDIIIVPVFLFLIFLAKMNIFEAVFFTALFIGILNCLRSLDDLRDKIDQIKNL